MRHPRILIVDDDLPIIKLLSANLKAEDYEVLTAMDGAAALETVERELPDLVILDIMMPKLDGVEVCRRLREWSHIPIIMLSARGDVRDKVECLNLGADDYVSKPFSVEVLLARVKAVLRRAQPAGAAPAQSSFTAGDLRVSFAERRVTVGDRELKLTPTEYNLLQELVLNANKVLTHQMLLDRLWGAEYASEKEYLHVFISRLRRELEPNPESPRYIITIPGVGYKFKDMA